MAFKGRSPWLPAVIGLVVALAFTTTLAVREWHRADRATSAQLRQQVDRHNVEVDAGALARALFTYDYRDLGRAQQLIQSLATGGFAQREAAQAKAVQAQLRNAKAVSTAVIKETTVSDPAGDHATAFVVLQTSTTSNGGQPATNIVYLHVHLQRLGALWKVDDVQNLAAQSS